MSKNLEPKNIEQLMAEADELIRQIHSGFIKDMEEEHRVQFEKHAQYLKKIKSDIQDSIEKKEAAADIGSGAEGTHEAIQEIVKAIDALKKYLV